MEKMTDESIMPYGKYKGKKMANVPASYLMWMHREGKLFQSIQEYVTENLDVLEKQEKEEIENRPKFVPKSNYKKPYKKSYKKTTYKAKYNKEEE